MPKIKEIVLQFYKELQTNGNHQILSYHCIPVEPNPPSDLLVSDKAETSSNTG